MSDSNSLPKYKSNNDIEQVLSESYSISSKDKPKQNEYVINKISSPVSSVKSTNSRDRILEKLELSSNKEIDIGLDLLLNKDKVNKNIDTRNKVPSDKMIDNNLNMSDNNISIGLDIDDTHSINKIESMVNDLNSENMSRLSQDEIDRLIDNKDKKELREPLLVSAAEIQQTLNADKMETRSQKSNRSVLVASPRSVISEEKSQNKISNNTPKHKRERYEVDSSINSKIERRNNRDEIRKQKQEILFKLEKMRRLGIQGIKTFNMSSDLSEMQDELNRVKREREIESSVKFQRKCLMAVVTGAELLNNKFDFLDFKLDGWSEQVHENIDEYNEVFEELHEKYKEKAKLAPELKLMFMLGGSAFMYHVTNSMFKNSIPGMEDIMKQNPDLMKQFASAAINQINDPEEKSAAEFIYKNAPSKQRNTQYSPPSNNQSDSVHNDVHNLTQKMGIKQNSDKLDINSSDKISIESEIKPSLIKKKVVNTPFNMSSNKISPPSGVDEILDELRSNTEKEYSINSSQSDVSLNKSKERLVNNKFNLELP